jgi:hypothetical protein
MVGVLILAACTNPIPGDTDASRGDDDGDNEDNNNEDNNNNDDNNEDNNNNDDNNDDGVDETDCDAESWDLYCETCVGDACIYRCEPHEGTTTPPGLICDGVFEFCSKGHVYSRKLCACVAAP